jgi:sirohydrochlorin ferrochelatase
LLNDLRIIFMYSRTTHIALAAMFVIGLPSRATSQTGLLVVAHGATAEWNAQVRETMAQVTWTHGPRALAFLMGPESDSSGWSAAVRRLVGAGARSVVVVPLLVSSHGSHYRQIQFYAGQAIQLPAELVAHDHGAGGTPPVPMQVTAALDDAPELLDAVALRWSELPPPMTAAPLMLLGHGPSAPEDVARWTTAFEAALNRVHQAGHQYEGRAALLRDDAPAPERAAAIRELRDTVSAMANRAADSVTVMTVLIARGPMTSEKIPKDLEGLPVRYAPVGLTPLPVIARWIERVAGGAMATP